jgi:type I restriction enzyme M protein
MNSDFIKRKSILENIDYKLNKNMFCELSALTNEATVEIFFINRLLECLAYKDANIRTKESIENFIISKGSKKINYKPDYIIVQGKKPLLVIDAKSPSENIDKHVEQCAHYCLLLNRHKKTVRYFLLSNGLKTKLYEWDNDTPLIELDFKDFFLGNVQFERLQNLIALSALNSNTNEESNESNKFVVLKKINKEDAQKLFKNCHKYIWNTEKRGVNSAFIEFVKLIFLKLWNDRKLHEEFTPDNAGNLKVPQIANTFSEEWIKARENDMLNPINDIQFRDLMNNLQDEVYKNKKKPLFDQSDKIELKPTTIKGVIKKLEHSDLFGIDEDLNGRLFETFLSATMRGSSLGQYFTPRSIVLLGTLIADLRIDENHADKVLDGSCGTGGYLIEALTVMRNKVRDNRSYNRQQKDDLIKKLCEHSLYGIDAAKDPKLARIARINMYLHGDGGSHIYLGDGLEKKLTVDKSDSKELQYETEEMIEQFKDNSFDVVLTNPPFSMWYEMSDEAQKNVLLKYELIKYNADTTKTRNRLRGSAMFIERYRDLLKPGGKLISIIDETILSSSDYSYVRQFIRENFIVRAIISLHGDAFQQSNARVKTAMIYLEKKKSTADTQPAAFMYSSVYLGIDDLPVTTKPSKVNEARKLAMQEIETILDAFNKYRKGESGEWLVESDRLNERFDVKYCIPLNGRFVRKWKAKGFDIRLLDDLCTPREEIIEPRKEFPDDEFRILTITYAGRCKADEVRIGKEINYTKMKIVRTGDIVFSEYNAFHGAIGYISEEFDGSLASGSYTVVRCEDKIDSLYLWSILRTTEIRADFLSSAIGMGRQTINWDDIKNVQIPFFSKERRAEVAQKIKDAWDLEKKAQESIDSIKDILHTEFDVESEQSKHRFTAAKPPK